MSDPASSALARSATAAAVQPAEPALATRAGSGSDLPRIPELDALRGLAALGVLALHLMPHAFFWAWSCVDLFFVLSGYLITSILLANARAPGMLYSFYARRILRIWPVYYLTFVVACVIFLLVGRVTVGAWPTLPNGQWLSLIFLQRTENYLPSPPKVDYVWYFDHSWSLAVEEQFYLLWPLLFLLLRPRLASLAIVCGLALLGAIWARASGAFFYLLVTRSDGLLLGILLAHLAADRELLHKIPLRAFGYLAALGLILAGPYLLSRGSLNLWGEAPRRAVEVTALCLVYAAITGVAIRWSGAPLLAPLRWRPLLHCGRLSFAIYMYQVPIGYLALEAVSRGLLPRWLHHPLVLMATLGCAQLSYLFVEQRFLALKRLFPYRRPRSA